MLNTAEKTKNNAKRVKRIINLLRDLVGINFLQSSSAILQASSIDATIIPYLENRLNYSYGCYGCRDATDIKEGKILLGLPNSIFNELTKELIFLEAKTISTSCSKKACGLFGKKSLLRIKKIK